MAAAKSRSKDASGYGSLVFFFVLAVLIGSGLGFAQLVRKSPERLELSPGTPAVVNENDETPPPWIRSPVNRQYLVGPTRGGQRWQAKRSFLASGQAGEVTLTVAELNEWAQRAFGRIEESEGGILSVTPGAPRFWIGSESLHLSADVTFRTPAGRLQTVYLAQGTLREHSRTGVEYALRETYLGRARLPRLPGVSRFVDRSITRALSRSEEFGMMANQARRVESISRRYGAVELSLRE